jgi:Protein of unknown function (DUF2934)
MQNHEQLIRERAYHLWEQEGRPEGRADLHWCEAADQVLNQSVGVRTIATAKRTNKRKSRSPA